MLCSKDTPDVRVFSVDVYEQEIRPGSRSAKHWHMADEIAYVISGEGYSEQWEVEAEIVSLAPRDTSSSDSAGASRR